MLNILLVYSGLETIPREIWDHPDVIEYCKKRNKAPSKCLLDINYHRRAMKTLKEWWMRGRPDIVHFCLLLALDSILNKEKKLRIFIHTRNNEMLHVKPETRIPRSYFRFKGLIEQLFIKKYIPNKKEWLLKIEKKTLDEFLKEQKFDKIFLLWENGKFIKPISFIKEPKKYNNPCIMIGGFQRGDFPKWILDLAEQKICIYRKPLSSWTVLSEIIVLYENSVL